MAVDPFQHRAHPGLVAVVSEDDRELAAEMGLFDEQEAGIDDHDAGDAHDRGGSRGEAAQGVGQADAVEQLAQRRRLFDPDYVGTCSDQMLQAVLVVGRGGDDGGHVGADRPAQHPEQAADDADRGGQRDRPGKVEMGQPRLLEGVRQRVDHVPERQSQDDRHQQAATCHQQVHRSRDHDRP